MKKITLTLAFVCVLAGAAAGQEGRRERKLTFQTSPLFLMGDAASLAAESDINFLMLDAECQYAMNRALGVSCTASFGRYSIPNYIYEEALYVSKTAGAPMPSGQSGVSRNAVLVGKESADFVFFAIKPMLIIRPFRTGNRGLYIGLYETTGARTYDDTETGESKVYIEAGVGMNAGYKWVFRNGFTMQLGSGLGKTWSGPEKTGFPTENFYYSDGRASFNGVDVHILDFKAGYSF